MKHKIPKVCVLMSTYNGEKYIKEQIDSILSQEGVEIKLVVRDDGSTDKTLSILYNYKNITLLAGNNIGCEASFQNLLHYDVNADYYAFADQDDVWQPRKIFSAIENIKSHQCDLSVCNLMLVDAGLKQIKPLFSDEDIEYNQYIMNTFAQSNLHGCVQVWTRQLHNHIKLFHSYELFPHDVLVNAVANLLSSTYIDKRCYINYRLHGDNVSGYTTNKWKKIKRRLLFYFGDNHPHRDEFCQQLINCYESFYEESDGKWKTIKLIAEYKKGFHYKMNLLCCPYFRSMSLEYRILWSLCVMCNKY